MGIMTLCPSFRVFDPTISLYPTGKNHDCQSCLAIGIADVSPDDQGTQSLNPFSLEIVPKTSLLYLLKLKSGALDLGRSGGQSDQFCW